MCPHMHQRLTLHLSTLMHLLLLKSPFSFVQWLEALPWKQGCTRPFLRSPVRPRVH